MMNNPYDMKNTDPRVLELLMKRRQQQSPDNQMMSGLGQMAAAAGTVGGKTADTSGLTNWANQADQANSRYQDKMESQDARLGQYLSQVNQRNLGREQQLADRGIDREQQLADRGTAREQQLSDKGLARSQGLADRQSSWDRQDLQRAEDRQHALDMEAMKNRRQSKALSVGAKETDKVFAKNRAEWLRRGGVTTVQSDLKKLKRVRDQLKSGQSVTGSMQGKFPDWWRSVSNPKAIKMREDVHSIVQKNLRVILGTQFTEREGQNILKRSWNEELPEEFNLEKVNDLISQIETGAQEQIRGNRFWEDNNQTLAGYETAGQSAEALADTEPEPIREEGTAIAAPQKIRDPFDITRKTRSQYLDGDRVRKNGRLMEKRGQQWFEVTEGQ